MTVKQISCKIAFGVKSLRQVKWVSGKAGHVQDTDANSDADTNLDPMQTESIIACVQCITLCFSSVVLVSPGKGWLMTPCIKYLHYPLSIASLKTQD